MNRPAVLICTLAIACSLTACFDVGPQVDQSRFFRLKVDFVYKGEPQRFDIVVGCRVLAANNVVAGATTREVGLLPTVFGREMSDGAAVVVRPPDACRGET